MKIEHLPERFRPGITRYLEHGVIPGDFLTAVLSNDLLGAFCRADDQSVRELHGLVAWCYQHIPHKAWGSVERVKQYSSAQQHKRRAEQENIRETCYFCDAAWDECQCDGPVAAAFGFDSFLVTRPAVSVCGRFYVDPVAYYGDAFVQARRAWEEYQCDHGCKPNAVCSMCGTPMCDHSHEIGSDQCLQCDR